MKQLILLFGFICLSYGGFASQPFTIENPKGAHLTTIIEEDKGPDIRFLIYWNDSGWHLSVSDDGKSCVTVEFNFPGFSDAWTNCP